MHRVGIANSRLVALGHDAVTFRTKNGKTVTVTPIEFLRRFAPFEREEQLVPERALDVHVGRFLARSEELANR